MLTLLLIDSFLRETKGPALRDGTVYAREARVGNLVGDTHGVRTVVRGRTDDFDVSLRAAAGRLEATCTCPSWRVPCKHAVAAVLILRQWLRRGAVPQSAAPDGATRRVVALRAPASGARTAAPAAPATRVASAMRAASAARAAVAAPAARSAPAARAEGGVVPGCTGPAARATRGVVALRAVRGARAASAGPAAPDARTEFAVPAPLAPRAESAAPTAPAAPAAPDTPNDAARRRAIEERVLAARREKLTVLRAEAPYLVVESASGFRYRVHLRGGADGPHGCECPDFEANRLHTCKHVERVRALLRTPGGLTLPRAHGAEAARARVYLHLGEAVEPRLLGRPQGRGAPALRAAFDAAGRPVRPFATDEPDLLRQLGALGPLVEGEALAWLERRAARRPELPAVPFPRLVPALPLEPYPFQWTGAEFLARSGRALLADEMGLGKTIQAILAALALRHAGVPARAVTIVCPASLRGGWQDEIARWTGERATLLEGPALARAATIAARPAWLVTHYEQVLRDHARHRAAAPDLLIIDEAQRAKGLTARTARVLKAIDARYVFALTGTPLENRLEEAYAIAQLVDQRLLPPLWQLDRDHFQREPNGRRVIAYRALGALRARLAPAFLRRRKEDVALQLPERVRSTALVPLHPAVEDTHAEKLMQVARIASKKVILPADLDRMQRLLVIARRCCDGPHMFGIRVADADVPKLRELEQALRDLCLAEGRKVVVFSEWTDMTGRVEALVERLGLPAFHLAGHVAVRQRPQLIRAFSTHDGPAVFISTDAGGVGLNLQAADAVINLDLPWNPARLEQRIARVHRIGAQRTVQVLLLVTEHTVEHRILALHDTKRAVLANVWAKDGEDVIAAPGGSGAFRELVQELLGARGPGSLATSPERGLSGRDVPVAGDGALVHAAPGAAGAAPFTSPPPVTGVAGAVGAAGVGGAVGAAGVGGAVGAVGAAAAVSAAGAGSIAGLDRTAVDPALLTAALAALAPAVPVDHRRSLASVFRALADALAVGTPPTDGPLV